MTTLNVREMLTRAQDSTGLSDYGDATLPQRFSAAVDLLSGIGMDADGRRQAEGVCHWLLTSRLEFFEDRNRYAVACWNPVNGRSTSVMSVSHFT